MTHLHELLAVEKSRTQAAQKLFDESMNKFKKTEYFSGHMKTLKMLADSPENSAIEESNRDIKELPTTVVDTLKYQLEFWAKAEDVIFAKNKTNQYANSDLMFRGNVLIADVPVDELLGLEVRLEQLRKLFDHIPTLDASKEWKEFGSGKKGQFITANEEITSKTEKVMTPVVLYVHTETHPAQVKESTIDKVVGTFKRRLVSGAATSVQKANLIAIIDELLVEVKQARQRANCVEASKEKIGSLITNLLLSAFEN